MAKKTNTKDTRLAYYKEMKQKHPDTILIFRSGSFYKTYDADASIVASILGITLTKDGDINVAAFPRQALDTYLPKLIRAGKQAAICDPMPEDEKAVETEAPAQEEEPQEQGEKQPEDMTIAELMAAYKALKEENRQLKEENRQLKEAVQEQKGVSAIELKEAEERVEKESMKAQHWMDKYQDADNHLRKVLESLSGYEFETGQ